MLIFFLCSLFIPFVYSMGKILEARQTGNSIVNPRASETKVRLEGRGGNREPENQRIGHQFCDVERGVPMWFPSLYISPMQCSARWWWFCTLLVFLNNIQYCNYLRFILCNCKHFCHYISSWFDFYFLPGEVLPQKHFLKKLSFITAIFLNSSICNLYGLESYNC